MKTTKTPFDLASKSITTLLGTACLALSASSMAQDASSSSESTDIVCSYNTTTPIVPDGNIATKDELISAQKRIKVYQDNLLDFRECLTLKEQALSPEAEDYEAKKAALLARSDESIDIENKVAAEFNEAIQIYKSR